MIWLYWDLGMVGVMMIAQSQLIFGELREMWFVAQIHMVMIQQPLIHQ